LVTRNEQKEKSSNTQKAFYKVGKSSVVLLEVEIPKTSIASRTMFLESETPNSGQKEKVLCPSLFVKAIKRKTKKEQLWYLQELNTEQ
jgi:hypothetical protein